MSEVTTRTPGTAPRVPAAAALRSHPYVFALALALALLTLVTLRQGGFDLRQQANSFAPLAMVAMASTPAILSGRGGIDMSVGPSMVLGNIMLVTALNDYGFFPASQVLAVLLLTTAVGAANGLLIVALRLPPVVVTLAMYFILLGVNAKLAHQPVLLRGGWTSSLTGYVGPVPVAVLLIALPVVLWWLLSRAPLGRAIYAVGGNDTTAFSAGVDVSRVRVITYAAGGLVAGLGSLALTALVSSADATSSSSYTLVALAAVALGGTSLLGGRGGLFGSMLGALAIYLLQSYLSLLQVPQTWLKVTYGALLLVAVCAGPILDSKGKEARS